MFEKIIKELFNNLKELLEDDNLVVFKRIVIIGINLIIAISPSILFTYLYDDENVATNGEIRKIILCLIYTCILFVIGYYAESFKGIYCNSDDMEIKVKSKKVLENVIGSIRNMGIISTILLIVYVGIRLMNNATTLNVKIGLSIIVIVMLLQIFRGICNYFNIKREIKIREDERSKFIKVLKQMDKEDNSK